MPIHPSLNPRDGVILAIETSNPSSWVPSDASPSLTMPGVAALEWSGGKPGRLAVEPCDPSHRDDLLLPAIDRAMRSLGRGPKDLCAIAVSIGPGGFTSLRIAGAAAKMLAISTGARLFAVPSARVVAHAAPVGPGPLGVALGSKGESAWIECFTDNQEHDPLGRPGIMHAGGLHALVDLGVTRLVADRFLPETMRAAAASLGLALHHPVFTAQACLAAARARDEVSPAALTPIYPRPPEAVRKWRELHPGTSSVPPGLLPKSP
ncbi:MAG: tRNA (adenosine(37)-N6)-threonylcarbamoyltransferase complex dimerization subunit type 1 TsaB [Planctomycetota bacterium]